MTKKLKVLAVIAGMLVIILLSTREVTNQATEPPIGPCAPPSVCTGGLLTQRQYTNMFTDEDLYALASTIAGEAGNCSWEQQCMVGWCVCNRFSKGWASTIAGICRSPGQFHGYGVVAPSEENIKAAYSVLHRWSLEQQGVEVYRELGAEYLWFCATGDGITNTFRSVY